jgi:hypothetical protein
MDLIVIGNNLPYCGSCFLTRTSSISRLLIHSIAGRKSSMLFSVPAPYLQIPEMCHEDFSTAPLL